MELALLLAQLVVGGAPDIASAFRILVENKVVTEADATKALAEEFRSKDAAMSEHDAKVAALKAVKGEE